MEAPALVARQFPCCDHCDPEKAPIALDAVDRNDLRTWHTDTFFLVDSCSNTILGLLY